MTDHIQFARELQSRRNQISKDFETAKKLVALAKAGKNNFALASAYLAVELGDDALGLLVLAEAKSSQELLDGAVRDHADCVMNINDALDSMTVPLSSAKFSRPSEPPENQRVADPYFTNFR